MRAKGANELSIRILLAVGQHESLHVYTDGYQAFGPFVEGDVFEHKYIVQGDVEYASDEVHVNTCRATPRRNDGGLHPLEVFRETNLRSISEQLITSRALWKPYSIRYLTFCSKN